MKTMCKAIGLFVSVLMFSLIQTSRYNKKIHLAYNMGVEDGVRINRFNGGGENAY